MKAIYVDDRLHRRLRLAAARNGRSIKETVTSAIELALGEDENGREVSTADLGVVASRGGSFDFLEDDRESVYTLEDGEPVE